MSIIKPFPALRPQKAIASRVASRPYDVLNSSEAREAVKNNPCSFLHITKAEVDLPPGTDTHSPAVYKKASENLQAFRQKELLFQEARPCYYIYRLIMNGRSQTGLVAASAVADYENNLIKKHELTRPEKEQDRIDHMKATGAQTGKVFLACNNVAELDALISSWKNRHEPEYDFTAEDGVQHTVWVVDEDIELEQITRLFQEKVPATYIADGHHRAASAAKVRQAMPQNSEAAWFLTVIFPAAELSILDYNRVVTDLNGYTTGDFIAALHEDFEITASEHPVKPAQLHEFGMYLEHKWYLLRCRPDTYTEDPIGILDVSILTENVLDKLLGIKDQRTDKRIDFVGGIRGIGELEKRVNSGEMKVAFSLYPVTIQQLFDIADSGQVMPPKSTWFEPKLRDGLLTHLL
ncbi:DUF1015 domain-containing protein [Niabella drilacis]|uniref:Uncharacterized conserved protein, DUF1015 family n=1 Tax=Niabella drilacis (strain DSM 25811 / CCM 8410 / CCUG 62505 / LMG 26954 / E90) TaxID=1285928 RepID=A0A1G6SBG7_NIADE|nr:DUF1015 family protein [Niabella drilacis]SDD13475.1 Uncharacterized conserved protein, DUF1015 family [Niabella drilacis]